MKPLVVRVRINKIAGPRQMVAVAFGVPEHRLPLGNNMPVENLSILASSGEGAESPPVNSLIFRVRRASGKYFVRS
jgi:hypothetical protein